MAEAAGLVLGVIPMVLWALEKYTEPFGVYSDYHNHIHTFAFELRMQQRQLQATLADIGLVNPTEDELRACLESKFPANAQYALFIIQRMEKEMAKLKQKLCIDDNQWTSHTSPWNWGRIKHSLSAKRRQSMIDKMRTLNADLSHCLKIDRFEVRARDENQTVLDLICRFNTARSDALRLCLRSLHHAMVTSLRCACQGTHQAALDLDRHLCDSAVLPDFNFEFNMAMSSREDAFRWYRIHTAAKSTTPYTLTSSTASVGVSSDRSRPGNTACLEEPPLTSSRFSVRMDRKRARTSSSRPSRDQISFAVPLDSPTLPEPPTVVSLCQMATSGIDEQVLPDCTKNYSRRFFLKRNDSAEILGTRLVPIRSLHQSQHQLQHRSLTLKERCGLAAYLAWSILHLGGSPWLDDDWDERQVRVILEHPDNDGVKLSGRLCFLLNLPLASCALVGNDAETPCPTEMSAFMRPGSFKEKKFSPYPNMTVVVLGILLVELCLGRDLSAPAPSIKSLLVSASDRLDKVYELAGESYGDAAKRCIKFCFSGRDSENTFDMKAFRDTFYRDVVAPLQATYMRF